MFRIAKAVGFILFAGALAGCKDDAPKPVETPVASGETVDSSEPADPCQELKAVLRVGDALSAQASTGQGAPTDELLKVAKIMEAASRSAAKVSSTDQELEQIRDEYRAMVDDAARLARKTAAHFDRGELEQAAVAAEQLEKTLATEPLLTRRLTARCP